MAAFDEAADLFVSVVNEASRTQPGTGPASVPGASATSSPMASERSTSSRSTSSVRSAPVADPKAYAAPGTAVAARARQAVDALGPGPEADGARERATACSGSLGAAAEDAVVGTPFGPVPLSAYLPTRTAELARIRSLDVADAIGIAADRERHAGPRNPWCARRDGGPEGPRAGSDACAGRAR